MKEDIIQNASSIEILVKLQGDSVETLKKKLDQESEINTDINTKLKETLMKLELTERKLQSSDKENALLKSKFEGNNIQSIKDKEQFILL